MMLPKKVCLENVPQLGMAYRLVQAALTVIHLHRHLLGVQKRDLPRGNMNQVLTQILCPETC